MSRPFSFFDKQASSSPALPPELWTFPYYKGPMPPPCPPDAMPYRSPPMSADSPPLKRAEILSWPREFNIAPALAGDQTIYHPTLYIEYKPRNNISTRTLEDLEYITPNLHQYCVAPIAIFLQQNNTLYYLKKEITEREDTKEPCLRTVLQNCTWKFHFQNNQFFDDNSKPVTEQEIKTIYDNLLTDFMNNRGALLQKAVHAQSEELRPSILQDFALGNAKLLIQPNESSTPYIPSRRVASGLSAFPNITPLPTLFQYRNQPNFTSTGNSNNLIAPHTGVNEAVAAQKPLPLHKK